MFTRVISSEIGAAGHARNDVSATPASSIVRVNYAEFPTLLLRPLGDRSTADIEPVRTAARLLLATTNFRCPLEGRGANQMSPDKRDDDEACSDKSE